MKSLKNNVTESILDVKNNRGKMAKDIAASAANEWLAEHCSNGHMKNYLKHLEWHSDVFNGSTWRIPNECIVLSKGDRWPESLKVAEAGTIKLINYDGTEIPEPIKNIQTNCFFIRNCPKLKSLQNSPEGLIKFSVSGCPELKDLKGCPKKVKELFKFINNGVKADDKVIKKYCIVDKKNIIYDHD